MEKLRYERKAVREEGKENIIKRNYISVRKEGRKKERKE